MDEEEDDDDVEEDDEDDDEDDDDNDDATGFEDAGNHTVLLLPHFSFLPPPRILLPAYCPIAICVHCTMCNAVYSAQNNDSLHYCNVSIVYGHNTANSAKYINHSIVLNQISNIAT